MELREQLIGRVAKFQHGLHPNTAHRPAQGDMKLTPNVQAQETVQIFFFSSLSQSLQTSVHISDLEHLNICNTPNLATLLIK